MKKSGVNIKIDDFLYNSPFPWWEWNVQNNLVKVSPLKVEMLGYDHDNFKNKGYQAYTDLLHKDDYERTMDAMRDLLEGRKEIYQVDYRIRAANGIYHWYMDRGTIISRLPDNSPEYIRGVVLDMGANVGESEFYAEIISLFRKAVPSDSKEETLLPVCSNCLKIRSEDDKWIEITDTLSDFITIPKSHTLCDNCLRALYPENADKIIEKIKTKKSAG